jgi:coenzyme F420 hydrogenase subunit beta
LRKRSTLARLLALRLAGRPVPDYQGMQLKAAARQNPLRTNLRNFLGMLRRLPRKGQLRTGPPS